MSKAGSNQQLGVAEYFLTNGRVWFSACCIHAWAAAIREHLHCDQQKPSVQYEEQLIYMTCLQSNDFSIETSCNGF